MMPLFQIQTSRLEGISFMTMTIRPETPSDEAAIEQVTRGISKRGRQLKEVAHHPIGLHARYGILKNCQPFDSGKFYPVFLTE